MNEDALGRHFRKSVGCSRCAQRGYRGRNVIAEVLTRTSEVVRAVKDRAPLAELTQLAIAGGMTTMIADAARKACEGVTSLQEAYRVAESTM